MTWPISIGVALILILCGAACWHGRGWIAAQKQRGARHGRTAEQRVVPALRQALEDVEHVPPHATVDRLVDEQNPAHGATASVPPPLRRSSS